MSDTQRDLQPRKIIGINRVGLYTLIHKEVGRFMSVYLQTLAAPVITTLLFYTIFALAFGGLTRTIGGVSFMEFLAPGLIMMTMVQNAFANSSSSIVIAKMQGNIVDVLMPPLSAGELYTGYILGSVIRGLAVGLVTALVMALFVPIHIHSFAVVIIFAVLGNMLLGSLGIAAGIWAEKFDHVATVTNFIITPLTFLSGTFYSVEQLPGLWRVVADYNPFFYMIDGFRAGFIGHADSNIVVGIAILVAINVVLMALCLWMIRTGYKIKS
ncbi:MAG: transport permease protein [Micavibrio sp.]|nr:MAG: transport permease protein [Micavibrio sp.]